VIKTAGSGAAISLTPMQMSGDINLSDPNLISLYFHVPFCKKKCDYCHFYVIPDKEPFKVDFMEGLKLEWDRWKDELFDKKVGSIYFGGGTPSLLGPKKISEILSWVRSLEWMSEEIEITLEANPEDINFDLMKQYASVGINRLSIGVQSLDDSLLSTLSRQHNAKRSIDAINCVRDAGIENISIDLMYDIPHQTLEGWEKTLDVAIKLPVTHLSLYNLVFEKHTVFYKQRSALQSFLPSETESAKMYMMAVEKCQEGDFLQYEISAFEKPGFFSQHNVGYWKGRPFLGFGPSAFSYWKGKRFRNVANLNRYLRKLRDGESPVDYEEELIGENKQRELLAINLRVIEGVDLKEFQSRHGELDPETHHVLQSLTSQGLLEIKDQRVKLTQQGILFYDTVASEVI